MSTPQRESMGDNARILIVDGDPRSQEAIAEALASEPFELVSVAGSDEAVELAGREPVDLILVDLAPSDTAADVCAALDGAEAPVVVLSADAEAAASNADNVVGVAPKPISKQELLPAITEALRAAGVAVGEPSDPQAEDPPPEDDEAIPAGSELRAALSELVDAWDGFDIQPIADRAPPKQANRDDGDDADRDDEHEPESELAVALREGIEAWDGVDRAALAEALIHRLVGVPIPRNDRSPVGGHGPGDLASWSDTMGLDEVLQALAAGFATGVLTLRTDETVLDFHLREGQLAFLNPRRVGFEHIHENALYGFELEIPGECLQHERTGDDGWNESVFFLFAEREMESLRREVLQIGIDVMRRVIETPGGYLCRFRTKPADAFPAMIDKLDLAMDPRTFLLRAHSMIDEFHGICNEQGMLVSEFCRSSSTDPGKLQGLTPSQEKLLLALDNPRTVAQLVPECRMGPMDVCFELYALVTMRLVENTTAAPRVLNSTSLASY